MTITPREFNPVRSGRDFSAYFIGGGAYTLPRGWRARYPEAALTIAEIDPEVTRMARDRL